MRDGGIYLYTGPVVSVIIFAAFFLGWAFQPQRRYVLYFALAYLSYAVAAFSQMLQIPGGIGRNTMITAIVYTFSVLCFIEGLNARFNVRRNDGLFLGLSAVILTLVYYFYYVHQSVTVRLYVQNFGYGLMFLCAVARIGFGGKRRLIDLLILGVFLLLGLHFFPRTIVTVIASGDLDHLQTLAHHEALRAFRDSPFWQVLNFSLLLFAIVVALVLLAAIGMEVVDDLIREGRMDPLTGLANRAGFDLRARALIADRSCHPLSVVLCDIDHFKAINDGYGVPAGDKVLQQFAKLLVREVRTHDAVGRFGGEEFVLLLAHMDRQGAARFAERLRIEVEATRFAGLSPEAGLTACFGVAEYRSGEDLLDTLLRADRLVYAAKHGGRNQTRVDAAAAPRGDAAAQGVPSQLA